MSLDALVRTGVALADQLTADLQTLVTIQPVSETQQTVDGQPVFSGAARTERAIVQHKRRLIRTEAGVEVMTETQLLFPRNTTIPPRALLSIGGVELGPIEAITGMQDPVTGRFYTEVSCGVSTRRR